MLLLFPASTVLAESQAAMVMVSGIAALNGTALAGTTSIFSGDLLETAANSGLTINTKGSTILIGANSRVHYFGSSIELQLGSTQVNTSQKLEVQTETIKVEPKGASAKFRVDRAPHKVVIAALENEVLLDNNGETTVIPQGTTVTLEEKDRDQAASPVSGPSNRRIFGIVLIAAGGTAAVLYGRSELNKKKVISNQIP